MESRKIQLVANSTYTVSLPKEWVKKNGLKEKKEIFMNENNDRTLTFSPLTTKEKSFDEITLNIDDYSNNIDQVMFSAYYLGIETINLLSKGKISKDIKTRVRKTVNNMSGTEISYEDNQRIVISVLLDKSKIDLFQIFYRMSLIIESSITNVMENLDLKELKINEDEIDRLYHLATKVISLSLLDSNILNSSKASNVSLIPAFLLISKRLENVGDVINHLSKYLSKVKSSIPGTKKVLEFVRSEISRAMKHIVAKDVKKFEKISNVEVKKMGNFIEAKTDEKLKSFLSELIRFVNDIEDEVVNVSFYNALIREKKL